MLRQKLLPAALFIMPAAAVLTTQATLVEAASEECTAKPSPPAPTGSRWYYRIDRVNHRRCWFLSSRDLSAHSRIHRTVALRHRDLIRHSSREADIARQPELDETIVVGSTPRQEPAVLPDEQTLRQSAALRFNALTSEGLLPHKVTTVSYARRHSGAPAAQGQLVDAMRAGESSARGANPDLALLGGALTALLIAGGALQIVGRIRPTRRVRQHYPTADQPDAGAERQKSLYERLNIVSIERATERAGQCRTLAATPRTAVLRKLGSRLAGTAEGATLVPADSV